MKFPSSKNKIMTPIVWVLITLTIILLVSATLTSPPTMVFLIWAGSATFVFLILLLISKSPEW